jgi:hypothetical protein
MPRQSSLPAAVRVQAAAIKDRRGIGTGVDVGDGVTVGVGVAWVGVALGAERNHGDPGVGVCWVLAALATLTLLGAEPEVEVPTM